MMNNFNIFYRSEARLHWKIFFRHAVLFIFLTQISACGVTPMIGRLFETPKEIVDPARTRTVKVTVNTAMNANPSNLLRAQPVKICVIVTKQQGWRPARESEGLPCTGNLVSDVITNVDQWVMTPGSIRSISYILPYAESRTFLVGAEFQQFNRTSQVAAIVAGPKEASTFSVSVNGNAVELNHTHGN